MGYKNPYQRKISKGIFHFLLWRLGYYKDDDIPIPIPENFAYPNPIGEIDMTQPLVTWINHSTFWIQAYGKSLLVDPIWNDRCSPLPFLGPKRRVHAVPSLDALPSLDVVVITHNHYDHLDYFTVKQLHANYPHAQWVIPKGVRKWFDRRFAKMQLKELEWWESCNFQNMTLTAVPAQHFSGRGLFDRNQSLWMGCVVEFHQGKRVYFAGDTGYNDFDFKEIKKRFYTMDLSLIPIGVYKPRSFMKAVHVNPRESIQIHLDVGSKLSVGGHWGTFRLSSEEMVRPPFDLFCALEKQKISFEKFRVLNPGQSLNW